LLPFINLTINIIRCSVLIMRLLTV